MFVVSTFVAFLCLSSCSFVSAQRSFAFLSPGPITSVAPGDKLTIEWTYALPDGALSLDADYPTMDLLLMEATTPVTQLTIIGQNVTVMSPTRMLDYTVPVTYAGKSVLVRYVGYNGRGVASSPIDSNVVKITAGTSSTTTASSTTTTTSTTATSSTSTTATSSTTIPPPQPTQTPLPIRTNDSSSVTPLLVQTSFAAVFLFLLVAM